MKYKKLLSAFLAAAMTVATVLPGAGAIQAEAAESPAPIKTFSFENDLGGSTAKTQANTGEYSGTITYDEGVNGQAVKLGSYGLEMNTGKIGDEYSISMWVKPSQSLSEHSALIAMSAPKGATECWAAVAGNASGKLKLWSNGDGFSWTETISNVELKNNEWSLITYTQSGKDAVLYINGIEKGAGEAAAALAKDGNDLYVGVNNWDALYNGLVDEVQVYDVALTEDQVYCLYDKTSPEDLFKNGELTINENLAVYVDNTVDFEYDLPMGVADSDAEISYESDNEEVAVVEGGAITGLKAGTANITITVKVGNTEKKATAVVTVSELDLTTLNAVVKEAKELDPDIFEADSYKDLEAVLENIDERVAAVRTLEDAETLEQEIRTAASKLVYVEDYKDPWTKIEAVAPKEDAAYKAGESEVLFTLPVGLESCVTVEYSSDNEEVATYVDGEVTAVADGTAILTTTVTAKYDGWTMEYGTYVTVGEKTLPYEDVAKDAWYYDAVYYNYIVGTMTGKDPKTFAPDEAIPRAQFAVILHRMNGTPEVEYQPTFPDVPDGIWFTKAILWAADTKVVTGYTDTGLFGPANNISRQEMAVMMYRYVNYKDYKSDDSTDISGYKDADQVQAYAKEAMEWAVGNGIISGKDNGTVLDPLGNATRAECATIIMRFMEKFE